VSVVLKYTVPRVYMLPPSAAALSSSAGSSSSSSSSRAQEPPLLVGRPSFSGLVSHLLQKSILDKKKTVDAKRRVLVTTPIFYVNGAPHIGHMFTCVRALFFPALFCCDLLPAFFCCDKFNMFWLTRMRGGGGCVETTSFSLLVPMSTTDVSAALRY
jgi:hypothetical protein